MGKYIIQQVQSGYQIRNTEIDFVRVTCPDLKEAEEKVTRFKIVDKIHELVEELKEKHPKLGLSFGYIGNRSDTYDDRGWYIFTNVMDYKRGEKFKFGVWGTEDYFEMYREIVAGVEGWIEKIEATLLDT